jgi:hypothetical protein
MVEAFSLSLFIVGTTVAASSVIAVILPLFHTTYHKIRLTKKLRDVTIVAVYDPPLDLTPAALGYLVDSNFDDREMFSMLLYLEQNGVIERKKSGGKIIFNSVPGKTVPIESPVLTVVYQYASTQPDLDDHKVFTYYRSRLELATYDELRAKGIVRPKISWSDKKYIFLAILQTVVVALILLVVANQMQPSYEILVNTGVPVYVVSVFVGFPLLLALLFYSEKINLKLFGLIANATSVYYQTWPQVEGYKMYLEKVELERLKYESDEQMRMDEALPYSVALNLRSKWEKWFI